MVGAAPLDLAVQLKHDTLRARLRRDTRAAHERVDAAAGALDLTQVGHRARFVQAHARAYHALAAKGVTLDGLIAHRLARAARDADALGVKLEASAVESAPSLQGSEAALGVGYVLGGSHLGNRMLARDWPGESALLTDSRLGDHWRGLLPALRDHAATGARADRVLAAALDTFAVFERAFAAHR